MRDIPLYRQSLAYANEHGELEQYRASMNASIACCEMLEKEADKNYRDYSLDTDAVLDAAVSEFGLERVLYVLAVTIRSKPWDGRFSLDNKAWAKTISIPEDKHPSGGDLNCALQMNHCHSCLTDMLASEARKYLPPTCFCVIPSTGELIIVKRGEIGHFPTGAPTISKEDNQEIADEINADRGISKAQAAAMRAGSMHGWNVPTADPRSYDKQGCLIYSKPQRKEPDQER